jgi:hypothetical protein
MFQAAGGLVEQFDGAKSKITITGIDADRVYNLLGKKNSVLQEEL